MKVFKRVIYILFTIYMFFTPYSYADYANVITYGDDMIAGKTRVSGGIPERTGSSSSYYIFLHNFDVLSYSFVTFHVAGECTFKVLDNDGLAFPMDENGFVESRYGYLVPSKDIMTSSGDFRLPFAPGRYKVYFMCGYSTATKKEYTLSTDVELSASQNPAGGQAYILEDDADFLSKVPLVKKNEYITDNIMYIRAKPTSRGNMYNRYDYFKFVLTEKSKVKIDADVLQLRTYETSNPHILTLKLMVEKNGYLKLVESYRTSNVSVKFGQEKELDPGTYYFRISSNFRGDYRFIVRSTSLETPAVTAPSQEEVAKLYVATFNRAPDAAGLDYWVNSGLTLAQIAQSFFDQKETQELYPPSTTNREFVKAVYQNLFNRDPDAAGWDYWEDELNNGRVSKNRFIEAVINGALGDDATILSNKTEVGIYFADQNKNNVDDAKNIMKVVTKDASSVSSAKQYILSGDIPTGDSDGTGESKVTWLSGEPDGYFTWQQAKEWCEVQGGRLPVMDELIYAWKEGGSQPSPSGFAKDTFYWSLDECLNESGCHQGCAMDAACPTFANGQGWNDDANGHPKCVMSSTISCKGGKIYLDSAGTTVSMQQGDIRYFDVKGCGSIEVMTVDKNVVDVNIEGCGSTYPNCNNYYSGDYMNVSLSRDNTSFNGKIVVTAEGSGQTRVTVSDNNGAANFIISVK